MFKQRAWGGRALASFIADSSAATVRTSTSTPIGEAWVLSDLPGSDGSLILGGPFAKQPLRHVLVCATTRPAILGRTSPHSDGSFPLLIKFLDAAENLSVQTHPSPKAGSSPGADPKHELWLVLQAAPNARVFRGIRGGVGKEEVARRARDGSLLDVMDSFAVRRGDAIWLPSGVVHALGAGLVVAEVQTPSDTTYRLWDWNRNDPKRPLHIDQACDAMDERANSEPFAVRHVDLDAKVAPSEVRLEPLHSSTQFDLEVMFAGSSASWEVASRGVPQAWTILEGAVRLTGVDREITRGASCVIPAVHGTLRASASGAGAGATILVATTPVRQGR